MSTSPPVTSAERRAAAADLQAWRRSIPAWALWAIWLATRAALYLLVTVPRRPGDIGIYQRWYACCLSHGRFPTADPLWQYPPGAALAFWLPGRLPGGYLDSFALLITACDLAVTLMLCAAARRGGSWSGAWYWTCGAPLLGAVVVTRFDMVPVALSVAALCLTRRGGDRGALIGAAAAIKLWPVTLLAGTPPGQGRRTLAAAAAVLAAACASFAGATGSFLAHQDARGAEIESVAATPFMIWRHAGWPGTVVFRFGAWQLSHGHAALAMDASRLSLVVVAAAVLGWRLAVAAGRVRWRPEFAADAPLAATLLFLVASPVLSPQYMLWVTGLAAVCLATGRTTQRPAAVAVLAAAGLTQVIFPIGWGDLLSGSGLFTGVLVVRNMLLIVAAVLSCRRILTA
jgi:Glycosyltransferase family 87